MCLQPASCARFSCTPVKVSIHQNPRKCLLTRGLQSPFVLAASELRQVLDDSWWQAGGNACWRQPKCPSLPAAAFAAAMTPLSPLHSCEIRERLLQQLQQQAKKQQLLQQQQQVQGQGQVRGQRRRRRRRDGKDKHQTVLQLQQLQAVGSGELVSERLGPYALAPMGAMEEAGPGDEVSIRRVSRKRSPASAVAPGWAADTDGTTGSGGEGGGQVAQAAGSGSGAADGDCGDCGARRLEGECSNASSAATDAYAEGGGTDGGTEGEGEEGDCAEEGGGGGTAEGQATHGPDGVRLRILMWVLGRWWWGVGGMRLRILMWVRGRWW